MQKKPVPVLGKLLLFLLFFVGIALNIVIFLDAYWWHFHLRPPVALIQPDYGDDIIEGLPPEAQKVRDSVLLAVVPSCDGSGENSGTAFVVAPGYLATAAHVVSESVACDSRIQLIDRDRAEHTAVLEGYSSEDDIAILSVSDSSMPPLPLADSSLYQRTEAPIKVVTVGYPLLGAASDLGEASFSGEGNLSRYDEGKRRFITSGLNVNPGNSGGPVFLRDNWQVVGIILAQLDPSVAEGIGYVVPINDFKSFFRAKTGRPLE